MGRVTNRVELRVHWPSVVSKKTTIRQAEASSARTVQSFLRARSHVLTRQRSLGWLHGTVG